MVRLNSLCCLGLLWPALLGAQQTPEINRILERLDKLEQENRALAEQVQQLKSELAASRPNAPTSAADASAAAAPASLAVDERLAIQESRVEEQAQTKVEASEKFPISLTGMVLF